MAKKRSFFSVPKLRFFQRGSPLVKKFNFLKFLVNRKAESYAIKTRSSKTQKIDIFPRGSVHGFGPKLAIFAPFLEAIQARKMCFTIIYNQKTPFQAKKKTRSSKTRKIDMFPRKSVHGFGPKLAILAPSFGGNISKENVFYDNL